MDKQLEDSTYDQITQLSESGNIHLDSKEYDQAIQMFQRALTLISGELREWEAATWLLISIADAYFLSNRQEEARKYLVEASHCPNGIGNAFLHLRLGQVQYDLGNFERSQDELARAYMSDGLEIFDGENEKYLMFLKTRMQI